jgi:hypothetical protein
LSDAPLSRARVANAVAFWERGRLGFNGVLALLVFAFAAAANAWVVIGQNVGVLFALGVMANVLYCAIYPVDLLMQATPLADQWRTYRWVVWLAGMALAILLAGVVVLGVGLGVPR